VNAKKILFVSHEGSITGAPIFLVKLLKHLKAERPKYTIAIIFSENGDVISLLEKDGFKVFVSEKRGKSNSMIRKFANRLAHYFFYLKVLASYRPDLVYSNTSVNFSEVIFAGLLRFPVLMHVHEGGNYTATYSYRLKISCFFAKRIIVGSHYVNSVVNSLTKRNGVVVHNGLDSQYDHPIKQRLINSPLKIGILGTIEFNKGQLVALEAMHLLVNRGLSAKLTIAGKIANYEYYARLTSFLKLNSLDKFVDFVGVVPDAGVFLNSLDLLVVPSFDEAFPTVILEAFSTSTLVLASDVGGISEMIQDKVNGLLFKAGDSVMLADVLEKVILDESLLQTLPFAAKFILKEEFDVRTTNNRIAINLDEMLDEAATRSEPPRHCAG